MAGMVVASLSARFAGTTQVVMIFAVLTAFLFPILLSDLGTSLLPDILAGASLPGAVVTWRFGIETKGVNLENLEH